MTNPALADIFHKPTPLDVLVLGLCLTFAAVVIWVLSDRG
jgi:hypothetical protein